MTNVATMVEACRLYYELGETQEQVAAILGMTRPQVSRLLKEARREGIVEIRIVDATSDEAALGAALRARFGLDDALIAPRLSGPIDLTRRLVGRRAAVVLRDHVSDGSVVGVGSGAAMLAVADALEDPVPRARATFVPLTGGGSKARNTDPTRRIAEAFGCFLVELFAPGLVLDVRARDALLAHAGVSAARDAWRQLDIALFGIGMVRTREPWFDARLTAELDASGAVGEILLAPYDLDGRFVSERLRPHVIGFDARELGRVPVRIGVAVGADRVAPVLGALRAGSVTTLVTDEHTARAVLELDDVTAARSPRRATPVGPVRVPRLPTRARTPAPVGTGAK